MLRLVLVGIFAWAMLPAPDAGRNARVWATDGVSIVVRTFQFSPERVDVPAGTQVVWTNDDQIEHTATAGSAEVRDSLFDLALARKGARATFTFEKPGTYAYYCARHPFMRGVVRVTPKGDQR